MVGFLFNVLASVVMAPMVCIASNTLKSIGQNNMPYSDPERRKKYQRDYHYKRREKRIVYLRDYRNGPNRGKCLGSKRNWAKNHAEETRAIGSLIGMLEGME